MKRHLFRITIKDCQVQTFTSGGPGGQHQNKTASGVRIIHPPSGARGESREHRSQHQNKRAAFVRMAESTKFQLWARRRAAEMAEGETIEEKVEREMAPENLRVEVREDGKWVVESGDERS